MEEFITYGKILKKESFNEIKNNIFGILNKPLGGLWCSPVSCEWSWKDWCEAEHYEVEKLKTYTKFKLKLGTKIYEIRSLEDYDHLLDKYYFNPPFLGLEKMEQIDFEALREDGWQGLRLIGDMVFALHEGFYRTTLDLNVWDCESMVLFSFDVIEITETKAG